MYERILVPLDGSELAEQVLPYVERLARRFNSETFLLTTIAPDDRLEHPLRLYMEKKVEELRSLGIKASSLVLHGDPATEILVYTDNKDIDLIAISSHGTTVERGWNLGCIANRVLQRSHAPIFLKRVNDLETSAADLEMRRILVTLDGSRAAEAIIPYAEHLSKAMGSELVLLRIIEPIVLPRLPAYRGEGKYEKGFMAKLEEEAERYLTRKERALQKKGIKVSAVLLQGKPSQSILQYAEDNSVNLIALTTHGFSGIEKWVYGSVASRIIESSSKSILLVRPPLPPQPED